MRVHSNVIKSLPPEARDIRIDVVGNHALVKADGKDYILFNGILMHQNKVVM